MRSVVSNPLVKPGCLFGIWDVDRILRASDEGFSEYEELARLAGCLASLLSNEAFGWFMRSWVRQLVEKGTLTQLESFLDAVLTHGSTEQLACIPPADFQFLFTSDRPEIRKRGLEFIAALPGTE
jgi:hypothetical protein